MLHAFLMECEKSMFWTASDQRVLRFLSSLVSRVVAALLDWSSSRDFRKSWYSVSHSSSQRQCIVFTKTGWNKFFAARLVVAVQKICMPGSRRMNQGMVVFLRVC